MACPSHNVAQSRRAEDLDAAVQAASNEYVLGKQWQPELLGTVLPLVLRTDQREKDFVAFACQDFRDRLLMLVPRVEGMPVATGILEGKFRPGF